MVAIHRPPSSQSRYPSKIVVGILIIAATVFILLAFNKSDYESSRSRLLPELSHRVTVTTENKCPYTSLSDLTERELWTHQGDRHMVEPPHDEKITLVCCQTTAGPWNIAVHHNWAPKGAERFVTMVNTGYFSAKVPLMRCIKEFLCQFGLSGGPQITDQYSASLADDPNWLPEGPTHRENERGVKRFAKGYLAYAGGGPDTRGNQFIVALVDSGPLAGGSPWEVPWGELVGPHSFETLDKVYTGYGEDGPTQGLIDNKGITDEVQQKFPKMDYINSCEVVDEIRVQKKAILGEETE